MGIHMRHPEGGENLQGTSHEYPCHHHLLFPDGRDTASQPVLFIRSRRVLMKGYK